MGGSSTSAPGPDKAVLVAAASNPVTDGGDTSAAGGVEGGSSTSAPGPGKAALVTAASNPAVGAREASVSGGVDGGQ